MNIPTLLQVVKGVLRGKSEGKNLSPKEKWMLFMLSGLLLAVIVFPVGKSEKKEKGLLSEDEVGRVLIAKEDTAELSEELLSLKQYERKISEELGSILAEMEGTGKVEAWVTLAASSEKILFQKKDSDIKNLQEEDHEGGIRKEITEKIQQEVLLDNSGNPYIIKTLQPEVEGVLVLAEGADNGTVKKNITEAVEVLFGIEAHRIKVAKKKVEE